MGADPLSPIAPARVRALILPVGRIKRSRFRLFVKRLRQEPAVRLGDITPDGRQDRNTFSPLAFPEGVILYDLSTSLPPSSHLGLSPFELFREPLVVLAVADGHEYEGKHEETDETSDAVPAGSEESHQQQQLKAIASQLREEYQSVLVVQLLVMDHVYDEKEAWLPDDVICIPSQQHSTSTTIKTAMCDISSKLLAEMAVYAATIRSLPNIQSPVSPQGSQLSSDQNRILQRQSSIRSQDPRSDSPLPGTHYRSFSAAPARESSSPALGSSRTASPPGVNGPATSFDEIADSAIYSEASRSTSINGRNDGGRRRSRDRFSVQGPVSSATAAERARNIGKARVGITVATLYLMAGRWSDAWQELVEHTAKARSYGDHLWYGKGLENILTAMLLFSWAGFEFVVPTICYPGADRPISIISGAKDASASLGPKGGSGAGQSAMKLVNLLPDVVNTIQSVYNRANTYGDALHPIAQSDMILRLTKLLALMLHLGASPDPGVFVSLVLGKQCQLSERPDNKPLHGLTKHKIAETLFQAYPDTSTGLSTADVVSTLSGIASVLTILQLERKRAIVMKELIASLVPALIQARKLGAAEMGIHPAASLSITDTSIDPSSARNSDAGIGRAIQNLQSTYSIVALNKPGYSAGTLAESPPFEQDILTAIDAAVAAASSENFGSLNLKIDILRACIDFCEAMPDLAGIVRSTALLLRIAGPGAAVTKEKAVQHVRLSTEEQARLLSNMARASNAAVRAGMAPIEASYWDDFLVRNVQLVEHESNARLIEHSKADLKLPKESAKTPFLYDAFAKKVDAGVRKNVVVANEPMELVATLQNPYDVEIEIEDISFATTGAQLDVQQTRTILRPARMQDIRIIATAMSSGPLTIQGCTIKVSGCHQQFYPIYKDPWAVDTLTRYKAVGVNPASTNEDTVMTDHIPLPSPQTLALTVTPPQPSVVVDYVSLDESALMLLEGEKKAFRVELRNTSEFVSTDFLHVSFEDSCTSSIRSTIASKELSRAEMYELESQLLHSPVFEWKRLDAGDASVILPGASAMIEISVIGRPGLHSAQVMFDFAHVSGSAAEAENQFFTRQVSLSINITVNASVQLHRIDINPFPSDFSWFNNERQRPDEGSPSITSTQPRLSSSRNTDKGDTRFGALLNRVGLDAKGNDHCLFLLDFRNAWPSAISVSLDVREGLRSTTDDINGEGTWKRAYTVHELIHPGHISRVVLLVPRLYLSDPYAQIPALSRQSERQFVVSSAGAEPEQERAVREAFWYREEILKHLRGTWREEGSDRGGKINLRGLRLTGRMMEIVGVQDVGVTLSVSSHTSGASTDTMATHQTEPINLQKASDNDGVQQIGSARFQVPTERFLTLTTILQNRTDSPIRAMLRLQPRVATPAQQDSMLDIGRKFVWSGLLQRPVPVIPPRGKIEVRLGFTVLCLGDFEVGAMVEEVGLGRKPLKAQDGADNKDRDGELDGLKALESKERRVWHSREPLELHAQDLV